MQLSRKKQKNKDDGFLRLTVVQLIAAVLIFVSLLLLLKKDNLLARRVRSECESLFSQDWDVASIVRDTYSSVFAQGERKEGYIPAIGSEPQDSEEGIVLLASASAKSALNKTSTLADSFYASEHPVAPVSGSVTSDYGYRIHPINGGESFHSGRDISADEGDGIRSVLDGVVIDVGVGEQSGNYIKIDHGNGLVALYCHCSNVYAEEGDAVRKGDIVAAVGQTGSATGPHLHFEIRRNGELKNPAEVLDIADNVY